MLKYKEAATFWPRAPRIRQIHRPIEDPVFGPFRMVAHPLHEKSVKDGVLCKRDKKRTGNLSVSGFFLVEVTGFEPATFWSRTKRATKLRYTSKMEPMKGLEPLTCGLRNRCSTD